MSDLPAAVRWIAYAWVALVGSAIGSFLNVVVSRVPAGESVVRPRSRCPRCASPIAWHDNVPVVSWLALRGKCRACGAPISARYPIVELLGAGGALLVVSRHGLSWASLAEFAFVAVLLALALIDLDTWLLPHALTWPLIALGVVASAAGVSAARSPAASLAGAGIGFAAFALVSVVGERVLKKEALGFGDVWLLAGLGAFLGVRALLPVVLLASIQGAVVGVLLIVVGKAQPGPSPEPPAAPSAQPLADASGPAASPSKSGAPPPTPPTREARGEGAQSATPTATPTPTATQVLADDDWVPPRNAVPFGPFLVAGALQWLWLQHVLARAVPALEIFRG